MASSLNGTGVTFSDSTSQASARVGPRGQVFTSSGTFTIPAGITAIKVTVVGAGGGGQGGTYGCNVVGGMPGAAGGAAIKYLSGLTSGGTLAVTIGTGGVGTQNSGSGSLPAAGGTGNTSSVASGTQAISTISATGGTGGNASSWNGYSLYGGVGSGGDINLRGGNAIVAGANGTQNTSQSGAPGASIFTPTHAPYYANAAAGTNFGYGGGGQAGSVNTGAASKGGNGGDGIVIIEW